eukprot:TRINITY_DN13578_c0_g1_i2.p1 TRINITY_DN13578_c0_g1~~TRINITY_DN13578_c0_g1_i2.p1  ORF type:complete len:289 (+),score=63.37 TRINITY_DN13578_c0_g1_i2:197-1063(+)
MSTPSPPAGASAAGPSAEEAANICGREPGKKYPEDESVLEGQKDRLEEEIKRLSLQVAQATAERDAYMQHSKMLGDTLRAVRQGTELDHPHAQEPGTEAKLSAAFKEAAVDPKTHPEEAPHHRRPWSRRGSMHSSVDRLPSPLPSTAASPETLKVLPHVAAAALAANGGKNKDEKAGDKAPRLAALRTLAIENGWLVEPETLTLGAKLGEGATADIYLATWHGLDIAVKCLRPSFFEQDPVGTRDRGGKAHIGPRMDTNVCWSKGKEGPPRGPTALQWHDGFTGHVPI